VLFPHQVIILIDISIDYDPTASVDDNNQNKDEILNTPSEDEIVGPHDVAGDNISDITSIVSSKKILFMNTFY